MTPATVVHEFARAGIPVVRYAKPPSLCSRGVCRSLDYFGGGIVAFLAPHAKPQFEVIVFRTTADAQRIAKLVHGTRKRNAVLYQLQSTAHIRAIFERINP